MITEAKRPGSPVENSFSSLLVLDLVSAIQKEPENVETPKEEVAMTEKDIIYNEEDFAATPIKLIEPAEEDINYIQ